MPRLNPYLALAGIVLSQLVLNAARAQAPPATSNPVSIVDQAATNGGNGFANLASGVCATGTGSSACDLVASPAYAVTEFSRFFDPAKSGNNDFYALMPTAGGIDRPRFAEDRRAANRYEVSLNAVPVARDRVTEDRTPFVWEARLSNRTSYVDNDGVGLLRQRLSGIGHNYLLPFVSQKTNFFSLGLNSLVRSAAQGGGTLDSTQIHTSPGDDMVFTVQHDTNGCSEGEDECNKLFRAFLQTTTQRWGGTLDAAPQPDAAGFGNFAIDVTVTPGYNPHQSGEDVFLVDLARPYTPGNVTAILQSPLPGFARFTADPAANWLARFGPSHITALTERIDNRTYSAVCPATVLNSKARIPDPMITDESGVGGLTAFCATVESTAGFTDGEPVTVAGVHSNLEMARVVHVVDRTHLTLNVQMYHDRGEFLSGGGAQGLGISMLADDIAPGHLINYFSEPSTTLRKFFPILGSDSDGSLLVYTDAAQGYEISSVGYMANHPNVPARIASVTMHGAAVAAVVLANPNEADYRATPPNAIGSGQVTLAPPTVTFTGPCATLPAATAAYNYPTNHTTGLVLTITSPGACSAPPHATLQTSWPNPYRIAPLAMTKKVIDPATGSTTRGHLLVGALHPADWRPGDLVEIPGWIHDHAGSSRVFGKYYTGASRLFGISDASFFTGDWAAPDTLQGILNQTDGHKYYATPAQTQGPGVAFEQPPNGLAFAGDYRIHLPLYTPPSEAVIDIGCATSGFGTTPYHPCFDALPTAYNLFQLHGRTFSHALRFDPAAAGLLSWSGPFTTSGPIRTPAVQLTATPARHICSAPDRGEIVYTPGAPGVRDTVQICAKDASDTFAWRTLF